MRPSFPPLMRGREARDPFKAACDAAAEGCDPGLVTYAASDPLAAALVLAPEVPLEDAVAMLPACGVGLASALGALGPPETAVVLDWSGGVRVNGAACGRLRAAAASRDPAMVPDWLVVGIEVPWRLRGDPGRVPERTALAEEGFDLAPARLVESWARHTLVWIDRWQDEGARPLHEAWRGLVAGIGREVTVEIDGAPVTGVLQGLDERFGMVLRTDAGTRAVPLSTRLEAPEVESANAR